MNSWSRETQHEALDKPIVCSQHSIYLQNSEQQKEVMEINRNNIRLHRRKRKTKVKNKTKCHVIKCVQKKKHV